MHPRRFLRGAGVGAFIGIAAGSLSGAAPGEIRYPHTPTGAVVDVYFGRAVVDPYRRLENGKDPAVVKWAAAETKLAADFLRRQPTYEHYKRRILQLSRASTQRSALQIRGGRWFYLRETPPQEQPVLVARDGLHASERVLFDPRRASRGGAAAAIGSLFPSPDGSKVGFTTQLGGSENETLQVVDAVTGAMLSDRLPHAGGGLAPSALAWDGDMRGFIHTQWPKKPDSSYATSGLLIVHHVLGTNPSKDTYVFGEGVSPRAEYALRSSIDGTLQAALEVDGDGVHESVYVRRNRGAFVRVASPSDGIGSSANFSGEFVGKTLVVASKKRDPRGEVVAIAPGRTFGTGTVVVPASSMVIDGVVPAAGGFITSDIDGGDSSARLFAADGTLRARIPLPPISTVTELAGDPSGDQIIVGYASYTTPNRWLAYEAKANRLRPTGIAETSPGDYSKIVAERIFVPSLDGKVKIPLEIVRAKRVKLNGSAPTLMHAYGAYGLMSTPVFTAPFLAWLERGGVLAQAMVRGGGEYGEAWHLAARHASKTLSSDDLAACAKWLAQHGYSSAKHLGLDGASAGGFLMGLALTRNPQLYRAVDSQVGFYDLLRFELTPNGAYNIPEFGTVRVPTDFKWMLAQSPYHNVVKGRAYPAILMTTGENDPRVDPYDSRKMIARLQASSSAAYPILLIQRSAQGHGIGNSFDQQAQEWTQEFTFMESQLADAAPSRSLASK